LAGVVDQPAIKRRFMSALHDVQQNSINVGERTAGHGRTLLQLVKEIEPWFFSLQHEAVSCQAAPVVA
jgi:hypothetical protein